MRISTRISCIASFRLNATKTATPLPILDVGGNELGFPVSAPFPGTLITENYHAHVRLCLCKALCGNKRLRNAIKLSTSVARGRASRPQALRLRLFGLGCYASPRRQAPSSNYCAIAEAHRGPICDRRWLQLRPLGAKDLELSRTGDTHSCPFVCQTMWCLGHLATSCVPPQRRRCLWVWTMVLGMVSTELWEQKMAP